MARDWYINAECLVRVKGARGTVIEDISELGLASEAIRVTPRFVHQDMRADDYGPDVPADVLWGLAEVQVRTPLVHFDPDVLDACLNQSMAGGLGPRNLPGIMAPAGRPMGALLPLFSSGCHYVQIGLTSFRVAQHWRFVAAYLTGPPVEWSLGTEKSVVVCNWRAIPYATPPTETVFLSSGGVNRPGEVSASGLVVWDRKPLESG